jgi:Flp pilus assembly protein TadB
LSSLNVTQAVSLFQQISNDLQHIWTQLKPYLGPLIAWLATLPPLYALLAVIVIVAVVAWLLSPLIKIAIVIGIIFLIIYILSIAMK